VVWVADIGLRVGDTFTFAKTIGETDVTLFAGITGDVAPHHIDEAMMRGTRFGGRIAHGVLVLGLASTASTKALEAAGRSGVSYGYDRVRFVAPVRLGDTVTVRYTISEIDPEQDRAVGQVEATLESGQVCLAATHILKFY
jgi:3-hydroxybutyryl-CoA dehydratase